MDAQVDYAGLFKNHSDIGICVFDAHGRFLCTNNTFLKIRNVPEKEYLGLTPHDLYNKNLTDKCILDSVYKTRTITTDVQTVMSKDGKILRKHLVTIQPILNEAGEITCAVAYYQDLESFTQEYDDSSARVHTTDSTGSFREWLDGTRAMPPFVAESKIMKELSEAAYKVSNISSTVLITGETGAGKSIIVD
ncbi:PAS domain-containing protein, partial [Candidatus Nomurabacteria bacterium]|nr:PAS domain-containing protein [Candidatus Nomurabacteria bacterium]